MSLYELAILGDVSAQDREALTVTIDSIVGDCGLELDQEVAVHDAASLVSRDKHAAFAAVYFGGQNHLDLDAARNIVATSGPIIPTVRTGEDFSAYTPPFLHPINGQLRRDDDPNMSELAVAMLECIGLLRRQRRAFVSYRRSESRTAAVQLHDLLTARGLDVFLDTHDIRPGDPFQDVLWHRLCDSDVVVMLDTPTYFDSKWTRYEIGRAREGNPGTTGCLAIA